MEKKLTKFRSSSSRVMTSKPVDLSQCLPSSWYDRVAKITSMPCSKGDSFEDKKKLRFKDLLMELDPGLVAKMDANVTEENFADIVDKYQKRRAVEVKIETRIAERKLFQHDVNWIAEYMKKLKKERIVWQTKLFKDNKQIHEKPLFEQTEELIDIAADHFAVWLKQMDDESNINKEFVKQLFSIEVESDASKALFVEPKEISVIPHEVSKVIKMPKLSVQNNVIEMSKRDRRLRGRKPQMVAFGRLLPKSIRRGRFNEDLFDDLYTTNCPEDLRSLKIVFESILNLSSTKALVDHLKQNPELPRAKYLEDNNMFDAKASLKAQKLQTPLWTYFA